MLSELYARKLRISVMQLLIEVIAVSGFGSLMNIVFLFVHLYIRGEKLSTPLL